MEAPDKQLQARLKRYVASMLKRPEDVEDIAQESFLKVLEAGSKGEIRYEKAYLYRTARNLALNSLTRKSNQSMESIEDLLGSDVLIPGTSLEDEIAGQQHFELFCRAAAALPSQCRRVLILRKVYGLSQHEVAGRLGISVSTVEKHLAKGLLRCSQFMASQGYRVGRARPVKA